MKKFYNSVITKIKNNPIEVMIVFVALLILGNTLLLYPIVGKHDQGDFLRMYTFGGLVDLGTATNTQYDGFVHLKYAIGDKVSSMFTGKNWMSGTLILLFSELIQWLYHGFKAYYFDIRVQALVYSVLFLIALFMILKHSQLSRNLKAVLGILLLMFFTDVAYISYFNSFYGESAVIVFFFLMLGTFLYLINKRDAKITTFVLFFVSTTLFLTSKTQEIPLLVFMFIVFATLFFFFKEKKQRITILCGTILVTAFCGYTYTRIDPYVNQCNMYQSVFTGVLMNSKDPEGDLKQLGLDPKFAVLAGTNFFQSNLAYNPVGEEMLKEFYPNISNGKVLIYYLKNPDRLWEKLNASAAHTYEFYFLNEHNFIKGQFDAERSVNDIRLDLANNKFLKPLQNSFYSFLIFSVIYFTVILAYFIKTKERSVKLLTAMLFFILLAGASQFILPVIGSGEADFGKHIFLLDLAYDTLFITAIVWAVEKLSAIIDKKLRLN